MNVKERFEIDGPIERLDKYLSIKLPLTRSHIKNAIVSGDVLVNGQNAKPGDRLKRGDIVAVDISKIEPVTAKPENIPIEIVYEDRWIAVVNKPQGMVVHPAPGSREGTLVGALLHSLSSLSDINGEIRPGIVHRIDKDTSGLLVVAKDNDAHLALARQIAEKSARRIYCAIVHGNIKLNELTIDKPIGRSQRDRKKMVVDSGGRGAITHIRVLERFGDYTYITAELETGRTHQIRVHLADMQRPVVGDRVYGIKSQKLYKGGQLLHAKQLIINHPVTDARMKFEAPLPDYFEKVLNILRRRA